MVIYLKLVLAMVFWGGAFVAGRIVVRDVGAFSTAFLRFALASVLLGVVVFVRYGKFPKITWRQFGEIAVLGFSGVFLYNSCFFMGLKTVEASRASVIVAANPVIIVLLAAYFFKERLGVVKVVGIVLSLAGAVTVISKGHPGEIFRGQLGAGEVYIFCCVLTWAVYPLLGKRVMKRLTPLVAVAYSVMAGTVMLFVPAWVEGLFVDMASCPAVGWCGIVYLGVFPTVIAFVWFYEGIHKLGAGRAGLFINFVPVFAVLSAYLILKEPVTWSLLAGMAMVVLGVYLTNSRVR